MTVAKAMLAGMVIIAYLSRFITLKAQVFKILGKEITKKNLRVRYLNYSIQLLMVDISIEIISMLRSAKEGMLVKLNKFLELVILI